MTQVVVQNWTTGTQTYSWTGADKVYIPVRRNMTNNLNVNVQCRRTTPMGMTGYALNVAGGGHTFYVGYPAGVYRA